MVTLEELASKGERKLKAKLSAMKENYEAAKDIAIAGYNATPFGPTRKAHYRKAWDEYAPANYKSGMTEDKVAKWRRKWIAAMSK